MACSKYEYVKNYEIQTSLLPGTYIVIRIDGKGFTKFCEAHNYEKPNDARGVGLMNRAAQSVLENFSEVWLAYGQSDEYSFVLRKNTTLYNRRSEKIVSLVTSCFSSSFTLFFKDFFPDYQLNSVPMFDGRCICYPDEKSLRDYLSWRQADCHINNLYNTCFWALVQNDKMTTEEAHKTLKGTLSDKKNEILFSKFGINYSKIEPIWRKGTTIIRVPVIKQKNEEIGIEEKNEKIEESKLSDDLNKTDKKKENKEKENKKEPKCKWEIVLLHEDIIQDNFWKTYEESLLL